ncbi:hypothetical protein ACFL4W_04905 [Planctomycetota bacterium]
MSEGRERWAGRLPFVMAAVGSAVGLGNIWRFPKVVFENGGGVFLIPYFIALITAGIPLMIVEYALGQKYQGGAPQAISALTKKFRWVGWFALLVGMVITFYYIAIMAWAFHYAGASFGMTWSKPYERVEYAFIDNEDKPGVPAEIVFDKEKLYYKENGTLKAPKEVVVYYVYKDAKDKKGIEDKLGAFDVMVINKKELEDLKLKDTKDRKLFIPFDQNVSDYFFKRTIDYHSGAWGDAQTWNNKQDAAIAAIEKACREAEEERDLTPDEEKQIQELKAKKISALGHMMKPKWILFLGAAITWLAIFLIIFKGVKNVGKVVMLTVPLPIIIILIIIIRGMTLPGAWKGIEFYLTPDWSLLFKPEIWTAAYGQIFFSLSLGFGILIAYASYQPKESDITNNAFLTSFANCSTSFLGGFAVFSVLGYLAHVTGQPVKEVVTDGVSLAFVTYPTALSQMGLAWGSIIGIIFFICLLSLGIDSAFSILEGVITGVKDNFPKTSKAMLTGLFCAVGFLVTAFVFCSRSGLMWLDIADNWMGKYGLILVGLFECLAIGYFGDLEELKRFINKHSEIKLHYWFDVFIKFITPAILIYLLSNQIITDLTAEHGYEGYNQTLSWSVNVAGWGLFGFLLLVWEGASVIIFLICYGIFNAADMDNPGTIAGMTTLGLVLLLGGFFHCLYIAMTEKLPAGNVPEPDGDPEEKESDDSDSQDLKKTETDEQ